MAFQRIVKQKNTPEKTNFLKPFVENLNQFYLIEIFYRYLHRD
jgi:hypothetical protein